MAKAKYFDVNKIIDKQALLEKIERECVFEPILIEDSFHDDDEVVNDKPYFKKVDGKMVRDEERGTEYHYVDTTVQSANRTLNSMVVRIRSEQLSTLEDMKAEHYYRVTFDNEKSKVTVGYPGEKGAKNFVTMELYATSVQEDEE